MAGIFTALPVSLKTLLEALKAGSIQLPDFQRGWVWDDDRIRSVLASVSRDFPIGAVMLLKTGGEVRFKARPVQGVSDPEITEPDELILDGQQRLTSIFQATIFDRAVETVNTKNQPIKRWYYIDMVRALDKPEEREEALISIDENRTSMAFGGSIKLDLSKPEMEYEKLMFPCTAVFDPADWRTKFNSYWDHAPEKTKFFDRFEKQIVEKFKQYHVPVITLTEKVPKEAVCHVFEKVNTGGITLNAFELLTATYAADNFPLRDDWFGPANPKEEILGIHPALAQHKVLRGVANTDFLQAVALLHTYRRQQREKEEGKLADQLSAVSCTRAALLGIPLESYKKVRADVLNGFIAAGKFIREQNIFRARDLPYQSQLVPLAAIIATLGSKWEDFGVKQKLQRWFWCGVLGELYGGAIEARFARDLVEVIDWVQKQKTEPRTIDDASFNPLRLFTLRTRGSAAYKGLYALLMREGGKDFRTGSPITAQVFEDEAIDIHHIFPKKWSIDHKIDRKVFDCIINKTAISARTNRIIGGNAPSKYLQRLEERAAIDVSALDAVLKTHLIDPHLIRSDDFQGAIEHRRKALLELVGKAMGKPVAEATIEAEPIDEAEEEDDDVVAEAA